MTTKKLLLIAVMVFLAALFTSTVFAADEESVVVKITAVEGKVLVMIQPSTEWAEAKVGMLLKKNDEIKTLEDGKAHLLLNDKTGFFMKPNSEIVVEMPVVEPYSEPTPEREPSYAPQNVGEEQASKT